MSFQQTGLVSQYIGLEACLQSVALLPYQLTKTPTELWKKWEKKMRMREKKLI